MLRGYHETYTTTTDSTGYFALDNIYADTYSLQASHSLFVQANRTITVAASLTTTIPQIGLWAGDINQDQDVDLYDWYLMAAAIYPVDDPDFDLNDDGLTNIQDLVILAGNQDQPNMTTTNPPMRSGKLTSQDFSRLAATHSTASLKLVPANDDEVLLHLEAVDEPVYAVGARLALPAGAAVTEVEGNIVLSGGFLNWHQEGQKLYIVVAPAEGQAITRDTDVAIIHGTTLAEILIEAENNIAGQENIVFLPLILK